MSASEPSEGVDPLMSFGMKHAGADQLYRILRIGLKNQTHYYRPFHPSLESFVNEDGTDNSRARLFESYRDHPEIVEEWFEPEFGTEHFFLDGTERVGSLDRYLVELANTGDPVHFHFSRGLGRLDYLRGLFPSARCLLIVRNPFAIWSEWHADRSDPYSVSELPDESDLNQILKALRLRLPDGSKEYWGFSDPDRNHPLDIFLSLWGFQYYLALQQFSDYPHYHALRFEDLVDEWEQSLDLIEEDLDVTLEKGELPTPEEDSTGDWKSRMSADDVQRTVNRIPDESPIRALLDQFEYS